MPNSSPTERNGPLSGKMLSRLRGGAGTQRLNSLDRLEQACNSLERRGTKITYEAVGRECERLFDKGPFAQSIRNDRGFKEYVNARRDEQTTQATSGRTQQGGLVAQIETISDATLRARLRLLYDENREIKRQLQQIRAGLSELTPGLDAEAVLRLHPNGELAQIAPPGKQEIDAEQIGALKDLLNVLTSDSALSSHSLKNDGKRIIRNRPPHSTFLPSGTLSGLLALYQTLTGAKL